MDPQNWNSNGFQYSWPGSAFIRLNIVATHAVGKTIFWRPEKMIIIMNKYFLVLLLTIFIVSCESSKNNTNKPTNNATKDTVIAVRDTVRIYLNRMLNPKRSLEKVSSKM